MVTWKYSAKKGDCSQSRGCFANNVYKGNGVFLYVGLSRCHQNDVVPIRTE